MYRVQWPDSRDVQASRKALIEAQERARALLDRPIYPYRALPPASS